LLKPKPISPGIISLFKEEFLDKQPKSEHGKPFASIQNPFRGSECEFWNVKHTLRKAEQERAMNGSLLRSVLRRSEAKQSNETHAREHEPCSQNGGLKSKHSVKLKIIPEILAAF
jgi:hypothetical protein